MISLPQEEVGAADDATGNAGMHSKAWIGILLIGVLGLVVLGLLTKFAIDANPDLQHIIRFKAAFAREFGGEDIDEVSLRKEPQGYHLVLTKREAPGDTEELDEEVAEFFAETFSDRSVRTLRLSYSDGGGFGCAREQPYRQRRFALDTVRRKAALRKGRGQLCATLREDFDCRFVSERFEGRAILVDLAGPAKPPAELLELARDVEPRLRAHYAVMPYARLHLRISPSEGDAPEPVEVRFDARGREVER